MFNFGSPEQTAALLWDQGIAEAGGPGIAEKPIDEMTLTELKQTLTYSYLVLTRAIRNDEDSDVIDILQADYLEGFTALCEADQVFRSAVIEGNHSKAPDHGSVTAGDYKRIALAADSES